MPAPGADPLSDVVHAIIKAGSCSKLVVATATPATARQTLGRITPGQLLAVPVESPANAHAMLAGLWLWHDGLHECHEIVQQPALNLHRKPWDSGQDVRPVQAIECPEEPDQEQLREIDGTLAFWHGIMHRREGDFSNAKYWFARCRHHPALAGIAALVRSDLGDRAATAPLHRLVEDEWQPDAFVDVVEAVHRNPSDPLHPVAVRLQQLEWRGLFQHCLAEATGKR